MNGPILSKGLLVILLPYLTTYAVPIQFPNFFKAVHRTETISVAIHCEFFNNKCKKLVFSESLRKRDC